VRQRGSVSGLIDQALGNAMDNRLSGRRRLRKPLSRKVYFETPHFCIAQCCPYQPVKVVAFNPIKIDEGHVLQS